MKHFILATSPKNEVLFFEHYDESYFEYKLTPKYDTISEFLYDEFYETDIWDVLNINEDFSNNPEEIKRILSSLDDELISEILPEQCTTLEEYLENGDYVAVTICDLNGLKNYYSDYTFKILENCTSISEARKYYINNKS